MTAAIRAQASTQPCDHCGAPAGEPCRTPDGKHVRRVPCVTRVVAAGLEPLEQQVCTRCHEPAPALVARICPDCANDLASIP